MAVGRMSHNWDLFSLLICFTVNAHPSVKKRKVLTPEKIHPFWEKAAKKAKPFKRSDWQAFGAAIRGEKQ